VESSVISFIRRAQDPADFVLFCCNFTPVVREKYEFGVPEEGFYEEVLNTDAEMFGGSNAGNGGGVYSEPVAAHGFNQSLRLMLPPLACLFLKKQS